MIVLADNDILLKLAICDLYAELLAAFQVTTDGVLVLNTARPVLSKNKIRKKCDDASFGRLTAFLAAVQEVDSAPDLEEMVALAEQPRIDTGEAALFSICVRLTDALLATGDKRSLTSLFEASSSNPVCASLCKRLAGKIICFEQIIERILDHGGFEAIRDRLIQGRECDGGLRQWLGSSLDANESSFREGLSSYLRDVRKTTGPLLIV